MSHRVVLAAAAVSFLASSGTALDPYMIPVLSQQSSDTHVVVEATIGAARHTDAESVSMSASSSSTFQLSNFTTSTHNGVKFVQVNVGTSTGAIACSFEVGTPEFTSDAMYPCTGAGGGGLIAYPQAGHVVVLGYHSVDG